MPKNKSSQKDYEFILSLEKTIEDYLCEKNGLSSKQVNDFNSKFNEMKLQFPEFVGEKQAGDFEAAPHFHFHQIATRLGRWLGDTLKIDWTIYGR